jgi:hypothetical protein
MCVRFSARPVCVGSVAWRGVPAAAVVTWLAVAASGCQQDRRYEPNYDSTRAGRELVAVYIGARSCGPCQEKPLKQAVERMKILLTEQAESKGRRFSVIGVATDASVSDGLAFLAECGEFDEVSAGRDLHNSLFSQHVWGVDGRWGVVPQVIVFEQEVSEGSPGLKIGAARYLARHYGAKAIPAWVEKGARLEGW